MDWQSYFIKLQYLANKQNTNFSEIIDSMVKCIYSRNSIWILGNGGSASTAEHFETDLSYVRLGKKISYIGAHTLTSNSALLTAIGNDIGFDEIFKHQLERKSRFGDIVFMISASGNSPNLIKAAAYAHEHGLVTIALLGFDGGKLLNLVKHHLLINSDIGDYGPVEDMHLAICHSIACELLNKLSERK